MESISVDTVKTAILTLINELEKQREYYNDLDSPIGDSDHGDSIVATFSLVQKNVETFDCQTGDIGTLFSSIGKSIIMSGGASMGPLYGTAFMDASKAVNGKKEVSYQEFVLMWKAFVEGIRRRGNVKSGEKTMFDTIEPAITVLSEQYDKGISLKEAIPLVVKAAEDGMNSTKEMLSTRGRSSRLGERSRGHIDPGAASMNCLICNFFKIVQGAL